MAWLIGSSGEFKTYNSTFNILAAGAGVVTPHI